MSEVRPQNCAACGGTLTLSVARVSTLSPSGFVDFFKCDSCERITAREQQGGGTAESRGTYGNVSDLSSFRTSGFSGPG